MNDLINNQNTILPGDDSHQASLTPGNVLGQYKVIRLLGRGGMGEVYEVEHAQMHKHYALKILPRAAPLMRGAVRPGTAAIGAICGARAASATAALRLGATTPGFGCCCPAEGLFTLLRFFLCRFGVTSEVEERKSQRRSGSIFFQKRRFYET